MKCPKCQIENPEAKKFCHKWSTKLSLLCLQCDSEYLSGDEFCGKCGHQIEERAAPRIKPPIGSRRSILWTGCCGSEFRSKWLGYLIGNRGEDYGKSNAERFP